MIDHLADLHLLDYKVIGLSQFGLSTGFYPRQLKRLYEISKIQGAVKGSNQDLVGDLYQIDEMMQWFTKHVVSDQACLIHGDYKADNIVRIIN